MFALNWNKTLSHFSRNNFLSPSEVTQAHQKWFEIDFLYFWRTLHDLFLMTASVFFIIFFTKYQASNWWVISVSSPAAIESTFKMSDKESSIFWSLSWPPTVEELCTENRLAPISVTLFLIKFLKSKDDTQTVKVNRLVDSYCAGFIHGVSKSACNARKLFLVALKLHNLTVQKKSCK